MADEYVSKDSGVAVGRESQEVEVVTFAPYRNRAGSPRVSPRVLGTKGDGELYAGSAGVEKIKLLELTEPDSLPTAFGMGLKQDKNAGSAGIKQTLTKGETSLAVLDLKYEKHEPITSGSARGILDNIKTAGGASGESSKLRTTSITLELMDDNMTIGSADGVSNKTKTRQL